MAPEGNRHTWLEDLQAIVTAVAFASLGLRFLSHAGLLTGGLTGVALLATRLTPLTFGQLYVLLNLPFTWLAVRQLGWRFTLKTFGAIGLTAVSTDALHLVLRLEFLHPLYAAVLGGALMGIGLLILFRHQASLGGLNVLAIWLQRDHGVRAGVFQLVVDSAVLLASLFLVSPATIAYSLVGAIALNLVLAVNHRPGRYLGA